MIKPILIGLESIQIAQNLIQSTHKLTSTTDNFQRTQENQHLFSQQNFSTREKIQSITNLAHDDSLSFQKRVQRMKQLLAKPAKVEIILANSEILKSSDVYKDRGKNGLDNPERSVIIEQSVMVEEKKEEKGKIKVEKQLKKEQLMDSMFNDSIFNKIEPTNKLPTIKEGFGNITAKKLLQPKDNHIHMNEQMHNLIEQNSRLKDQLNQLKKMILSFGNHSKNSFGISIEHSEMLKVRKILTQSVLQDESINTSVKQRQIAQQKCLKYIENLRQLEQKYQILNENLAKQKKMKEQLQEMLKSRTKLYQSQISAIKSKINNPCGKNFVDILTYLNNSFAKIHENSIKTKCANMIITHVSAYISN